MTPPRSSLRQVSPRGGIAGALPPVWLALFLGLGSCLAPAPPIVVETPFGDVHAGSEREARQVAELLRDLAPEVRRLLPGSQAKSIDVWVQPELQVFRFHRRPESVRGFTLLSREFDAKRIHLQEGGQSPWYLAHELVHALIGPSWAPLPGILEEGLGDVIAENLNPEYRYHIRAHRLLNASAFTEGIEIEVAYLSPQEGVPEHLWQRVGRKLRLAMSQEQSLEELDELLGATRGELHERWEEIPESFYGIAWLFVSRITERHGIEGLYELCLRATDEGLDVVPAQWIYEAAEVDLDTLDAAFLAACFRRQELRSAIHLQPVAFGEAAMTTLAPLRESLMSFPLINALINATHPVFVLPGGAEIPMKHVYPLREALEAWVREPDAMPLPLPPR